MKTQAAFSNRFQSFSERNSNLLRLLAVFVIVFAFFAITKQGAFLKPETFASMAVQLPEYSILALGVALTLISGGIDLSVVGIANLAGILMALFLSTAATDAALDAVPLYIAGAAAIGFLVGLSCGAFNGLLVSRFRIPPILATMGTMQIFTGLAIVITEGKSVSGLVPAYEHGINSALFGWLPVPLLMFIACAAWVSFVLNKTNYGQKLYMLGTNEKAAAFSGIHTNTVLMKTYIYSGLLAIVASLIMMGRNASAKADTGSSYTLQCVLICVLGGVKTEGGFGKVSGIVVAVLILQTISTGLNLFREINNFYRGLIWGAVLVAVLIANCIIEQKEQAKLMKKLSMEEAAEA